MPDSSGFGCVQKYVMPRNPAVPELTLRDVLSSEILSKNSAGQIVGDAIPVWRSNTAKLTVWSMLTPGTQYVFRRGWIYVTGGPNSASELLFEGAKEAAKLAVPGISEMAGPLSNMVEELAHGLIDEVKVHRGGKLRGTTTDVVAELERRGTLCLPAVDLVEVEYHVDPPTFLHRMERHRCVMTYERPNGARESYTMAWRGLNGKINVTGAMGELLACRRDSELEQLAYLAMAEYADFNALFQTTLDDYTRRYGEDAGSHWSELQADVATAYVAALNSAGYSPQRGAAATLEQLAPLIPSYDQVPVLKTAVDELRALAAGGTPTA